MAKDDLRERLQVLEDERAILQTLHQYGHAMDYGPDAEFIDCFTPRGRLGRADAHARPLVPSSAAATARSRRRWRADRGAHAAALRQALRDGPADRGDRRRGVGGELLPAGRTTRRRDRPRSWRRAATSTACCGATTGAGGSWSASPRSTTCSRPTRLTSPPISAAAPLLDTSWVRRRSAPSGSPT